MAVPDHKITFLQFATSDVERQNAWALEAIKSLFSRNSSTADISTFSQAYIMALAERHGLFGFVANALIQSEGIGLETKQYLSSIQRRRTIHALRMAAETLSLASLLERHGIQYVLFKGCLLAQLAHGNCAIRDSCDIDIVVRRTDIKRTIEILQTEGYQLPESWNSAIQEGHFRYDCECPLQSATKRISIDLHWDFTAGNFSLPMPVEQLIDRSELVDFQTGRVRSFTSEDLVILLTVHHSKHYWEKLEWALTLASLINMQTNLDWDKIISGADSCGIRHMLFAGLWIAEDLFAAKLPPHIHTLIRQDHKAYSQLSTVIGWMLKGPTFIPDPSAIRWFHTMGRGSIWKKISYWFGVVATPTEKDYWLALPAGLTGLYYPMRALRLLISPFTGWQAPVAHRFRNSNLKSHRPN